MTVERSKSILISKQALNKYVFAVQAWRNQKRSRRADKYYAILAWVLFLFWREVGALFMPGNFATRNRNRRVGFGRIMRSQSWSPAEIRRWMETCTLDATQRIQHATNLPQSTAVCSWGSRFSLCFLSYPQLFTWALRSPAPRRRRGIESCTATARSI